MEMLLGWRSARVVWDYCLVLVLVAQFSLSRPGVKMDAAVISNRLGKQLT